MIRRSAKLAGSLRMRYHSIRCSVRSNEKPRRALENHAKIRRRPRNWGRRKTKRRSSEFVVFAFFGLSFSSISRELRRIRLSPWGKGEKERNESERGYRVADEIAISRKKSVMAHLAEELRSTWNKF